MGFFHYFPSMILARSYYSLRYGVISVENLVKRAAACGMDHLCLTDINNTSGIIELTKYCHEHGLRPIIGIEFRNRDAWLYTGIAKSHEGLYHLNNFLSHYRLRKKNLPPRPPVLQDVIFIFSYGTVDASELEDKQFLGIRLQDINKIVGKEYPGSAGKLMAIHPVTFLTKEDLEVHRHLRAIDHNTLLTQLDDNWLASDREFFYTPDQLKAKYQHFPELAENASIIENLPDRKSVV